MGEVEVREATVELFREFFSEGGEIPFSESIIKSFLKIDTIKVIRKNYLIIGKIKYSKDFSTDGRMCFYGEPMVGHNNLIPIVIYTEYDSRLHEWLIFTSSDKKTYESWEWF